MKKNNLLLKASLAVMFLVMFQISLSAQTEARRITYEAKYTTVQPAIDGFIDPVWDEAMEGNMDQIVEGDATTANGTFKVLWDEDFLYFLIQVNDPIRSAWDFESETVNPWMYDCVEIFLGPANHPEEEFNTGDGQYRFTPGIPGLYNPWADPRTINELVEFAEQDNDTEYIFEIAWPWEHIVRDSLELLDEIINGKIMEFEIQFADNNTPGEPVRDNVIAWNNDTDNGNSWANTHLWGFLELTGGPVNVTNINSTAQLTVYPSPANHYISIKSDKVFTEISVINMIGQNIVQRSFASGELNYTLDLSQITQGGIYFLNVITETGRETKRFVVVR